MSADLLIPQELVVGVRAWAEATSEEMDYREESLRVLGDLVAAWLPLGCDNLDVKLQEVAELAGMEGAFDMALLAAVREDAIVRALESDR